MSKLYRINNLKQFFASAQLFFSLSILFGTWVLYIPVITEKLNINEGQLGITLLFGAIGSLIGTLFAKPITTKFGVGKTAFYSILAEAFFIISLFTASNHFQLTTGLFFFGVFGGIFQVSVNALVITIESIQKKSIMSACHAFFSLGGMMSAGFGTILLVKINNALLHIIIIAIIVLALQLLLIKQFYTIKSSIAPEKKPNKKSKLHGILVCLSLIAMTAMVSEGAIADWSGLYLKNISNVNSKFLGLGYAGFSLAMTIGRFTGDYFNNRFGSLKIVLTGFLISLLGFIAVLTAHANLTLIGFIIIGTGFSIIVPIVYQLSANLKGINPANGIAFIAGTNYIGFLAGPPLLGFVAEKYDLSISFIILFLLVTVGSLLTLSLIMRSSLKLANSD